jgi:hypothetical protein
LKTNSIVVVDCQRTRGHTLFQEDSDSVIRTHANRQAVHELAECVMPIDRLHPAVKHGAYSATAVLPGESGAEFEKLHRGLIAELVPSGVLEDDMTIARLVWRKQNLATLRIAECAQSRLEAIVYEKECDNEPSYLNDREDKREIERAAESEAQEELGEIYEFVEIGSGATFDGLTGELAIQERLDAAINRCLKQLLMVSRDIVAFFVYTISSCIFAKWTRNPLRIEQLRSGH